MRHTYTYQPRIPVSIESHMCAVDCSSNRSFYSLSACEVLFNAGFDTCHSMLRSTDSFPGSSHCCSSWGSNSKFSIDDTAVVGSILPCSRYQWWSDYRSLEWECRLWVDAVNLYLYRLIVSSVTCAHLVTEILHFYTLPHESTLYC